MPHGRIGVTAAAGRHPAYQGGEVTGMTATASRASAAGQAGRPRSDPAWLTNGQLTARLMSPLARCAAYGLNPEDSFPIATGPTAHEPNPTTL
jgi:hypothetical protein